MKTPTADKAAQRAGSIHQRALTMTLEVAIARANAILPGWAAPAGELDPRWQAIIAIGEHIENDPEPIWAFARRWGSAPDPDLRAAIATCLLEHLLEHHFVLVFDRVRDAAREDPHFAETVLMCWSFGQSKILEHHSQLQALRAELTRAPG